MTPTIRPELRRGKVTWIVDYTLGRKRRRKRCKTKAIAENVKVEIADQIRESGHVWIDLTDGERKEVVQIVVEAKRMGVTLRDVWSGYLAGSRGAALKPLELGRAVKLAVDAKRTAKRSERYLDGLEDYLLQFVAGRESVQVAQLTHVDIEEWFDGRREQPATRKSNMGRLNSMFGVLVKRGYLSRNPCDALETIRLIPRPPAIFTPEQCRKALEWAQDKPLLPWLVLSLLCGLRPEEADHVSVSAINWPQGWLIVDAETSKVRQRRVVHLTDHAKIWLGKTNPQHFAIPRSTRRRWLRKLRKELGLKKWPQDVLRHTFASFTMAEVQDAGKVAAEMGNSAAILMRDYRELMTKTEAAKYREILPTASPSPSPS